MTRWLLLVPAFLFVLAALIPAFRGGKINYTFFAVAVVWFVIAIAVGKARKTSG